MNENNNDFKQTKIGKIPEEWELKKIIELDPSEDTVQTGPFGSILHTSDYAEEGHPLILVKNIEDGKIIEYDIPRVNFEKANELKKFWLKEGDIVFTRVGAVGRTLYIGEDKENWMFSGQTLRIRINNPQINNRFIEYYFRTPTAKKISEKTALGTTRPSINTRILKNRRVPVPPLNEQDKIVKILSSIDKKIKLNDHINQNLERLIQTIFERWFIDFEFPNEDGKPYMSSGGKMRYSKKLNKEIPKGWEVKPFTELIDINPKRKIKKGTKAKKVGMADIKPWQSWVESWQIEPYKYGSKFKNGDTLFAQITPSLENGKTSLVMFLEENEIAFGSSEFMVLSPKNLFSDYYVFCLSRTEEIRGKAIKSMTGTSGRQRVQTDLFEHLNILSPTKELIRRFDKIAIPIFDFIRENASGKSLLSDILDALLPKLMSGEIRVDTDKFEVT